MSIIDEDWDYFVDLSIIEKSYHVFEANIVNLLNNIESEIKSQTFLDNHSGGENQDDELKVLLENNKELLHQKDKKLEENSIKMIQYEKLKKEQNSLNQEIKKTHEAFLMAKKYYKKFLKIYYTIESRNETNQTIFIQFFTEVKKESNNYSVTLLRNLNTGHFEILSTTPKLSSIEDCKRKLCESNDVPGMLCNIRQAFLDIKLKKA